MTDRSEPTTAAGWNHAMEHAIERAFHPMANADQRDGFIRGWKARGLATLRAIEAEARQPSHSVQEKDSEALRLLRARIDAEPFFPKGDGPSIGNAAAFRDYKRRILAALPPSDPPALAQPSASIDVERLAQALFYSIEKTLTTRLPSTPASPRSPRAQPAEDADG